MSEHKIRLCPHCKLQYVPDPKQHKDPHEYCPRCGKKLKDDTEVDDE